MKNSERGILKALVRLAGILCIAGALAVAGRLPLGNLSESGSFGTITARAADDEAGTEDQTGTEAATVADTESSAGSITVTNAKIGSTYTAYRLFNATLDTSDSDEVKIAYQATAAQKDFYEAQEGNVFLFTVTTIEDVYIVSVREDIELSESDVTDFLQALAVSGALDELVSKGLAQLVASAEAVSDELVLTGLPYGYYYVTSLMGSVISVTNVAPDAEIEEKNEAPTVDKSVSLEEEGEYSDSCTTTSRKKTVYFLITVHAHKGASEYVLHDQLDEGFDLYADTIVVTADDTVLTEGVEYTLLLEDGSDGYGTTTDGCTFEIVFSQSYLDGIDRDTDITVEYQAKLNKSAVKRGNGNWNTTWLEYGEKNWTTDEAEVVVYYKPKSSSSSSSGSSSSTSGTLPQTGQLNWPVPVLAVLGMVLFLTGFGLQKERQKGGRQDG